MASEQKRALISVSDKRGLEGLARGLVDLKFQLFSTGGTQQAILQAGIPARPISELTGFPEILGGRVKTLHPSIFAGILARREVPEDMEMMERMGLPLFDVVVVNLYPFRETVAKPGISPAEAIEQIDIGGPSLLRATAKAHEHVIPLVDPTDYATTLAQLKSGGPDTRLRKRLAAKVFIHTSEYDAAIAAYLQKSDSNAMSGADSAAAVFPRTLRLEAPWASSLRYGENPHQMAALYRDPACEEASVVSAEILGGKELSFNNLADLDTAIEVCKDFDEPVAVILKHANPCGLARAETVAEAYRRARDCDPDSAFGGIVGINRAVDVETAALLAETFLEAVAAPAFRPEALALLTKKKNLRILRTGAMQRPQSGWTIRSIVGGFLVQDRDLAQSQRRNWRTVTKAQPTEEDLEALHFAWRAVKWVKSNAIVYADLNSTIGIGAGQMSRVDAARLGIQKARRSLQGLYLASDAFFPFRDVVDLAADAGIRAMIQPGGSIRDPEVIEAANERGVTLVFTGQRHFRH